MYLFFEKCKKSYYDNKLLDARIATEAALFATPANTKSEASRKTQQFRKFMDSLDFDKIINKKKLTVGKVKSMFSGLPIKIKGKQASETTAEGDSE